MLLPILNKELIPLSKTKPIYTIKDDESVIVKVSEGNELLAESEIQKKAYKIVSCPEVKSFFTHEGKNYLIMERILGKTIYEIYGDNEKNVPKKIWQQIREIITKLYYEDIHYLDISPYNFILDKNDKVYIIDFGDACIVKVNWFLKDFLDGENSWNSDFY
jgi:hypothetical protein